MVKPSLYFWKKNFRCHLGFIHTSVWIIPSPFLSPSGNKSESQWSYKQSEGLGEAWAAIQHQFPWDSQGALVPRRHLLLYKGLLGNSHLYTEDVPFSEQTWPWMSDQTFDSYPEWDWNHHRNAYVPKGHLFLKYAHLYIRQFLLPFPIGNYF